MKAKRLMSRQSNCSPSPYRPELTRRWAWLASTFDDDIAHVLQNTKKRPYFV